MNYVVVTGVSTGIGRAAAEDLAAHGYFVFGSVRRTADAEPLRDEVGPNFTALLFDVTDHAAIQAAAEEVRAIAGEAGLAGLVNSAGLAVGGPLMHLPLGDFRRQFEVNVFGTLAVTQAFWPLLRAGQNGRRPAGRIVNISSVNGRVTYPFIVPYCAAKHALEALSDGLRRELIPYGIDVIVIEPDAVQTDIWDKAEQDDMAGRFARSDYGPALGVLQRMVVGRGRAGMPASAVSRAIRTALESRRPKARYVLTPNPLLYWHLPRWLPDRWFDRIIATGLKAAGGGLRPK